MWQGKSRRNISGGRRKTKRKRRKYELGRETLFCKVSDSDTQKKIDVRGKTDKIRAKKASKVNVTDPETGKTSTEKIEDVLKTPANPHFVRRNVVTKGTVVKTSGGKAKITSRPGQDGQINAIKVED
ncbi:MAG: 30S ribosomal protein S8e [Candidatus Aenigmatarchaeota archaeon]